MTEINYEKVMFFCSSNVLISLFSISPLWFVFIGASITVIFGLISSFVLGKKIFFLKINFLFSILDSKDSKLIDLALVVSRHEIFPCYSPTKVSIFF